MSHEIETKVEVEKDFKPHFFIFCCIIIALLCTHLFLREINKEKHTAFHKPHCIELSRRAKLDQEIYYKW